jgi:hypothetical protein
MYELIGAKVATKFELTEYYSLEEALKLHALWRMTQDIEAAHAEELKKKIKR